MAFGCGVFWVCPACPGTDENTHSMDPKAKGGGGGEIFPGERLFKIGARLGARGPR